MDKMCCTLLRRADIINCIVDDELEVLVQQSFYQRGVGNTFSICQINILIEDIIVF